MKTAILTIVTLLSLSAIILNIGPVLTEGEITHGQRVYENICEVSADSLPITISKEDGRALTGFIEGAIIGEWRSRFFLVVLSSIVLIAVLGFILIDHREKAKQQLERY